MSLKNRRMYSKKLRRKIDSMHLGKMYFDAVENQRKKMFGE